MTANHRFLLLHLAQVDALKAAIDASTKKMGERLALASRAND
ncbi:MAG: hypothetical protein R3B70_32140 [Polyangiaceae bacterium]